MCGETTILKIIMDLNYWTSKSSFNKEIKKFIFTFWKREKKEHHEKLFHEVSSWPK